MDEYRSHDTGLTSPHIELQSLDAALVFCSSDIDPDFLAIGTEPQAQIAVLGNPTEDVVLDVAPGEDDCVGRTRLSPLDCFRSVRKR